MKLKASKNKGSYKTVNTWLNAVYRNNKEFIDTKLQKVQSVKTGKRSTLSVFKELVKENIEEGMRPTQALNTVAKSTVFTDVSDRLKSNAYHGLLSDKDAYKKFRELTKERGKYTKIDANKFQWDSASNSYIYGSVRISFKNSPFEVIVGRI